MYAYEVCQYGQTQAFDTCDGSIGQLAVEEVQVRHQRGAALPPLALRAMILSTCCCSDSYSYV